MNYLFSGRLSAVVLFVILSTPTVVQPLTILQHTAPQIVAQSERLEDQNQLHIFTGIIVASTGGMFFLKDETTKTLYGLDNQDLARRFANRVVAVTGTLDKSRTIHIKSIEEPKA